MTSDAATTVDQDRPIPPVPDTFPSRHRGRTPPREYFCRSCWVWYVSECPEHGRAMPVAAAADPAVEQERRERLSAAAATVEGQNDAAALREGPMTYALLRWARQTNDGPSEVDLAEWREEWQLRFAQQFSPLHDRLELRDAAAPTIAIGSGATMVQAGSPGAIVVSAPHAEGPVPLETAPAADSEDLAAPVPARATKARR